MSIRRRIRIRAQRSCGSEKLTSSSTSVTSANGVTVAYQFAGPKHALGWLWFFKISELTSQQRPDS